MTPIGTKIQSFPEISTQRCDQEAEVVYVKTEVQPRVMLLPLCAQTSESAMQLLRANKATDGKLRHKNQTVLKSQNKIKINKCMVVQNYKIFRYTFRKKIKQALSISIRLFNAKLKWTTGDTGVYC